MRLALGNEPNARQVTIMVEQQVQLDRPLGAAKLRPVKQAYAQIHDGGVQAQQLVLETKTPAPRNLPLVIAPVLLGSGEHLLNGIDMRALGYECVKHVAGTRAAAHVILRKRL